jgi:hypothetical protein
MKSKMRRAGYAGFFRMEKLSASLLSSRSRLFGKACTPCTNLPGSMSHNAPLKAFEETGEVRVECAHAAHILHECCTSWEKLSTNVLMTVCWLVGKIPQFFGGMRRCEPQQHLMAGGRGQCTPLCCTGTLRVSSRQTLCTPWRAGVPPFCTAERVGHGLRANDSMEVS